MGKIIAVVHAMPGKRAQKITVTNTLENLQRLVGGGDIESISRARFLPGGCHAYCHEEGKFIGLEPNVPHGCDVIVGPIVISCCDGDGEEIGLEDWQADEAVRLINQERGL